MGSISAWDNKWPLQAKSQKMNKGWGGGGGAHTEQMPMTVLFSKLFSLPLNAVRLRSRQEDGERAGLGAAFSCAALIFAHVNSINVRLRELQFPQSTGTWWNVPLRRTSFSVKACWLISLSSGSWKRGAIPHVPRWIGSKMAVWLDVKVTCIIMQLKKSQDGCVRCCRN